MEKITNALNSFGIVVPQIISDDKIHRCHSNAKTKKNLDGWYVSKKYNDHTYCIYGCWIRGTRHKVSTNDNQYSNFEVWTKLEKQYDGGKEERLKIAIDKATKVVEKCVPASPDHPYLKEKQISSDGLYQLDTRLLIPLYNTDNKITSYQTITSNGVKRFMKDGVVKGSFFKINGDHKMCICEGYATGRTIHDATGYTVIVSFNANNMIEVCQPCYLVCADNDHTKKTNTGIETAKKTGCQFVFPANIEGSDFNDMYLEKGIDTVKDSICNISVKDSIPVTLISVTDSNPVTGIPVTTETVITNDSLQITDDMIPDGLISEGVEALNQGIIQYTLPLVLTLLARAIAGKIRFNKKYPNVFNIKIGGTSTGKTLADEGFRILNNIDNFISMNDMASGPALWKAISINPTGMGLFDEVKSLFQRTKNDILAEGKANVFLEVYSGSGKSFTKCFSDSKNNVVVKNPCFSLLGNTTPKIFDAIQSGDFETGLMQRFDFWLYDGDIKFRKEADNDKQVLKFIDKLKKIIHKQHKQTDLKSIINDCINVGITDDAELKLQKFSEYIITTANREPDDGCKGLITRKYDLSIKYALIHHASNKNLFSPLTLSDINYGILIADKLCQWKIDVLINKIVSGDFHRDCNVMIDSLKSAMSMKSVKNITFKTLCFRKKVMNNWDEQYFEKIKRILVKKNEILVSYNNKQEEIYYLV